VQILGVFRKDLTAVMAEVLGKLGASVREISVPVHRSVSAVLVPVFQSAVATIFHTDGCGPGREDLFVPSLLDITVELDEELRFHLDMRTQELTDAGMPPEVARLIEERQAAREARDWQQADSLREAIRQMGYEVEDAPDGPRWRRSAS